MKKKITNKDQGQRLDVFLVTKYSKVTRSQIQKAIKQGKVLINDKVASKNYCLKTDDVVKANFKADEFIVKKVTLIANNKINIDVVFEDKNYLIVNKPANLVIHPGDTHPEQDTLINGVIAKYPEILEVGENKLRPGIVHRLDREVSGLIVIAKTQEAFIDLKKQFKNRGVYKEYIALVHGILSKDTDIIDFDIIRSKTDRHKMAAKPDGSGREAITEYDLIKQYNNYALLKIVIHTGRTHQIRVHLNSIGHPVLGDQIYRPRSLKSSVKLNRIFLHAKILRFNTLEGELFEFKQELPKKLDDFLKNLSVKHNS